MASGAAPARPEPPPQMWLGRAPKSSAHRQPEPAHSRAHRQPAAAARRHRSGWSRRRDRRSAAMPPRRGRQASTAPRWTLRVPGDNGIDVDPWATASTSTGAPLRAATSVRRSRCRTASVAVTGEASSSMWAPRRCSLSSSSADTSYLQVVVQSRHGTVQVFTDRGPADVQQVGHITLRPAEGVDEHHDGALLYGKPVDRLGESPGR